MIMNKCKRVVFFHTCSLAGIYKKDQIFINLLHLKFLRKYAFFLNDAFKR